MMSREMKHSGIEWIGEIPKEWKTLKFKTITKSMKSGGTPTSSNAAFYNENGTPWVAIGDMRHCGEIFQTQKHLTEAGLIDKSLEVYPCGTLLYSIYASVGKVSVLRIPAAINQAILALSLNEKAINGYGKYLLVSMEDYVFSLANGNTQFNLNASIVANLIIPLPPLSEQQKIANYLDMECGEVDEMIVLQEQMIEELKAYKQSVITEAVTKGLNPDVSMKDSGIDWIGEIPEHWEIVRLKALGGLQNGISQSGDYFGEDFEYPFISYSDVYKNIEIPYPSGRANSTIEDRTRYSVQEGDVLFTRTSETIEEIGFAATCTNTINNAVFSGFLIRFRPNSDKLYKGYSKYYFRSDIHRAYFVKEMNLVTRASLSQDLLKNLFVLIPSYSEQQSIASYLDTKCAEIDALIAIKQAKIEELKDYKKSVIYEYVTGKKEVV